MIKPVHRSLMYWHAAYIIVLALDGILRIRLSIHSSIAILPPHSLTNRRYATLTVRNCSCRGVRLCASCSNTSLSSVA